MSSMVMERSDLQREVEQFLFLEADLMDRHRYDDWLALWDEQVTYWVPCNEEDLDPKKSVSLIYEHRDQLEDRLYRLNGRHAHAQSPKSRLLRVVSNVRLSQAGPDSVTVTSNFVVGEVRLDRQIVLFGRSTHLLLRRGEGLRIREKKVFLINNDAPMGNVTFLV